MLWAQNNLLKLNEYTTLFCRYNIFADLEDTLGGGGSSGSGGGSSGSGGGSSDEAPNNVVFSKTILDPDAKWSRDYEESASDVIKTSGGDYVVVGTSISCMLL